MIDDITTEDVLEMIEAWEREARRVECEDGTVFYLPDM